jgi:translation elongation factor EF-1alpha
MTAYKQKRILFLSLALMLSGTIFGQTSKDCSKTVPCEVLDIAQARIEKGDICEQQRKQDSTIIRNQADIILKHERTISERDQTIEDIKVASNRKDTKITELQDKVEKRGRQRFTWSSIALLGGRLLAFIF